MDYEAKTKIKDDYYTSNLIKCSTLSDDCIGIILSFVLWNPQIGDLIIAEDRHADDYPFKLYDGIITHIYIANGIFSYYIHYIGWIIYKRIVKIKNIKPYVPQEKWKSSNPGDCTLSIINKIITHFHPHKVILFIQHDKEITKEIITKFSITIPEHFQLCSHVLFDNPDYSMYIFVTTN